MGFLREAEKKAREEAGIPEPIKPPRKTGNFSGELIKMFCTFGFLICAVYGSFVFAAAQSALHEIEAFILFLIASVLFASTGVINAVDKLRSTIEEKVY